MAIVTGLLRDFSGQLSEAVAPRIIFQPSGAAVGEKGLFFSRPVIVDTFTAGGAWSVDLQPTDPLWRISGEDVFYIVSIERLVGGADYFPWDHTGWKLHVPAAGGEFAALVRAPSNPRQIWFGPTPPFDPSQWTGWYKTDALPGEDNYFEWEE